LSTTVIIVDNYEKSKSFLRQIVFWDGKSLFGAKGKSFFKANRFSGSSPRITPAITETPTGAEPPQTIPTGRPGQTARSRTPPRKTPQTIPGGAPAESPTQSPRNDPDAVRRHWDAPGTVCRGCKIFAYIGRNAKSKKFL